MHNSPEVSPDGRWIVCSYRKDVNSTWRYAIIPYEGGEPVKVFDLLGKRETFAGRRTDALLTTYEIRKAASQTSGVYL